LNVAKKNTKPVTDQPAAPGAAAPAKRRAAKKASPAAAPVDVATVSGNEPIDSASDTGATPTATENRTAATDDNQDNQYEPTHEEIAEAAYFRHLRRGGTGGAEFDDWVEAERELKQRRR
jgi:hypothetical protein